MDLTPAQWNALPAYIRDYVHHLETDADPAGTLRENYALRQNVAALCDKVERLRRMIRLLLVVCLILIIV